jgi:hypothetical protein
LKIPFSTLYQNIFRFTDLDIFKSFRKGTFFLKEGSLSTNGYFVLNGCLRSFYLIEGDETTKTFYTELEIINPQCVLSGQLSEYYISCVAESIVVVANLELEKIYSKKLPKFEMLCSVLSE